MRNKNKNKQSLLFSTLILSFLQDFSSGETNFYFYQFLSNFLKYFFLNFLLSQLYNIFAIYFHNNSSLSKSLSSTIPSFSYCLTSVFFLSSNFITTSFIFYKFSSFFQISCSTINLFHLTKYFMTPLIFLLFKIFSTSYSSTSFTFTSFTSSTFCLPTCSLYHTI